MAFSTSSVMSNEKRKRPLSTLPLPYQTVADFAGAFEFKKSLKSFSSSKYLSFMVILN
jgi:hypothetical protein